MAGCRAEPCIVPEKNNEIIGYLKNLSNEQIENILALVKDLNKQ
ncbi:hypothetical protein [Anaerofustis stercorihominis]|nr:hypothetical protein [Anaerofustis stercorihominis]